MRIESLEVPLGGILIRLAFCCRILLENGAIVPARRLVLLGEIGATTLLLKHSSLRSLLAR